MNIVLFEDQHVRQLDPITLSRPAYTITCGSLRLLDLARMFDGPLHGAVRPYLTGTQHDYIAPQPSYEPQEPTLLLNARLVPEVDCWKSLREWVSRGQPGQVATDNTVLAAFLPHKWTPAEDRLTQQSVLALLGSDAVQQLPTAHVTLRLFAYPHDVIANHERIMRNNLEHRRAEGDYREVTEGVFAAPSVSLPPQTVCDTSNGLILLDEGVRVGPFCYLQGPIHAARGARISPHSVLTGAVAVGHTTKVGGEVQNSIIEPYSNKQHFGFLGHAYVGSWVNLGAGTTNSNLKNTYGTIRVQYGATKIDTQMQFLGCVIGDFTKTAINTSIYTGKMIGACSNVYGVVTTNVPSFANYARSFGEVTELPASVMETTQRRMFRRRSVEQRPCDIQLLRDMYELETKTRELANQPPSL